MDIRCMHSFSFVWSR